MMHYDIHLLFNIYLIVLFIGVLAILLKLHDIKLLLKTFFETTTILSNYISKLESELHEDEYMIESRVNKVHEDIINILEHMNKKKKDK